METQTSRSSPPVFKE